MTIGSGTSDDTQGKCLPFVYTSLVVGSVSSGGTWSYRDRTRREKQKIRTLDLSHPTVRPGARTHPPAPEVPIPPVMRVPGPRGG